MIGICIKSTKFPSTVIIFPFKTSCQMTMIRLSKQEEELRNEEEKLMEKVYGSGNGRSNVDGTGRLRK